MGKPKVKYVLASERRYSNHSENSYSVVATSTPSPSPDELQFAKWHSELTSIVRLEAIENPSKDFEDVWFSAICKTKAPRFKARDIFGVNEFHSDDLKSVCLRVWNKTIEAMGKVNDGS